MKFENITKVLLIGINKNPPIIVARKAYIEIVNDGISSLIFLVKDLLIPKKIYLSCK